MNATWNQIALRMAEQARVASRALATAYADRKNRWLLRVAEGLQENESLLLSANAEDLRLAKALGLSSAQTDRLRLSANSLAGMRDALRTIARFPDPVGEIISGETRPNGLKLSKVRVPLGVIFFIYESRPNVTVDAAALCVKSGNAVILRGGKEALHSNIALYNVLSQCLAECDLPREAVQLVQHTERELVDEFLRMGHLIDLTIPRGGKGLIERVAAGASMPVLKHLDGICHVYVDRSADLEMAVRIVLNSKAQRPGVCNAAETLLVHEQIASAFIPIVGEALLKAGVEIRGCEVTRQYLPDAQPANEEDWRTEYLSPILSVGIVHTLEQAVAHIEEYGSHHTDAIVTEDLRGAEQFIAGVDSSAVLVNASTRFNDGGELGLGAEIGISTDKFHARGPCGLRELTSYKYVIRGAGQIRE